MAAGALTSLALRTVVFSSGGRTDPRLRRPRGRLFVRAVLRRVIRRAAQARSAQPDREPALISRSLNVRFAARVHL